MGGGCDHTGITEGVFWGDETVCIPTDTVLTGIYVYVKTHRSVY